MFILYLFIISLSVSFWFKSFNWRKNVHLENETYRLFHVTKASFEILIVADKFFESAILKNCIPKCTIMIVCLFFYS